MAKHFLRARSFLFLPADRLERLNKAIGSGAHMTVIDLEDAVGPGAKDAAREALRERWSSVDEGARSRIALRINAALTPWHGADLELVSHLAAHGLASVVLPKAETEAHLADVARRAPSVAILPLVESAEGIAALETIARAPGVARLVFGHLDFQLDLGMQCGAEERELDYVRFQLVAVSRRAELPAPVDGVTVELQDPERLAEDCARSRRFGFGGKLCIHPQQVSFVNQALEASAQQLEWARRIVAASETHDSGAFQLDGAMVDAPVIARARSYLASSGDGSFDER